MARQDARQTNNAQTRGGPSFNPALATDAGMLFDDLDFPANCSAIRRFAQDNEAGADILAQIDNLPDQIYDDADQLLAAMANPNNTVDEQASRPTRGLAGGMDEDEADDMDSNGEPSHLSSQAVDPGEFKQSARESKRPLDDGRDD